MAIEKAKYNVLEREGNFELRQYEPHIVAETMVDGDFEGVGNEGFRRLYDYISGKNRPQEAIDLDDCAGNSGNKIREDLDDSTCQSGKSWRKIPDNLFHAVRIYHGDSARTFRYQGEIARRTRSPYGCHPILRHLGQKPL